jgi:hypothetical protein
MQECWTCGSLRGRWVTGVPTATQLRERKDGFLAPKRHQMKHLDFLILFVGIQAVNFGLATCVNVPRVQMWVRFPSPASETSDDSNGLTRLSLLNRERNGPFWAEVGPQFDIRSGRGLRTK